MTLEQELHFFEEQKDELLKHYEGQFALIKGTSFSGAFTTEAEAYQAGINLFGNVPFLIKRVKREETVAHIPAYVLGMINVPV